jgi:hypothetical protein
MTTWVLILSLAAGYGASVNSVPGFASQAVCSQAGEQWKGNLSLGTGTKASFVCVNTQAQ